MGFTRRATTACFVIFLAYTIVTPSLTSAAAANTAPFSRNLQLWDSGSSVRALQQFLNVQGYLMADSGPGSPGHETTTFGPHTLQSLARFQRGDVPKCEGERLGELYTGEKFWWSAHGNWKRGSCGLDATCITDAG
jgi:hypothetical protein